MILNGGQIARNWDASMSGRPVDQPTALEAEQLCRHDWEITQRQEGADTTHALISANQLALALRTKSCSPTNTDNANFQLRCVPSKRSDGTDLTTMDCTVFDSFECGHEFNKRVKYGT